MQAKSLLDKELTPRPSSIHHLKLAQLEGIRHYWLLI